MAPRFDSDFFDSAGIKRGDIVTAPRKPRPTPAKRSEKAVEPSAPKGPKVPPWLEEPTRAWWLSTVAEHDLLEEHHLRLLTLACEAWDRGQQARAQIADEGPTYVDRFDAPRMHPAVKIEHDARIDFARILRELDLDGAPGPDPRQRRRGGH